MEGMHRTSIGVWWRELASLLAGGRAKKGGDREKT